MFYGYLIGYSWGYLVGGSLAGAYHEPIGTQSGTTCCFACQRAQEEARNRNIDAFQHLAKSQMNDSRLAELWRRFRANEVTGVIFDDTQ